MQVKISELLGELEPLMELPSDGAASPERVKELTMAKISHRHRHWPWKSLLIACALCISLCVGAFAGGKLTRSEIARQDMRRFIGEDTVQVDSNYDYLNNGVQHDIYRYKCKGLTGHSKEISYYKSGEIYLLDARESLQEYWPGMSRSAASAYARMVESIAPEVLNELHEGEFVKGVGKDIRRCFCNDFSGEYTVFNGGTARVYLLMEDDTAYVLWLNPQSLRCEGFGYFDEESTPKMYDGIYGAMANDTLESWWYALNHSGLG
ncbi:MAG: hypothetical protein KBS74_06925 [Clostridiales bacterium]|nr:hypothetical protein [Candidatus Cacconaster stercorequi]